MAIVLTADATAAAAPLAHFWSTVVGAGRASEGLRATWQEQLRVVTDLCGFRYVRFHGIFHDDMFVYQNGSYNFQYVDDLFDRMLASGVRPFVELGFMPSALAREPEATVFWWRGIVSPPADFDAWAELVRHTVQHWVDRYGLAEVRQWYFEVWNEPNLPDFWTGTRSEYFELYRVSVSAIKGVDAQLRVGGPATSNFVPDARFAGEREDVTEHATVTTATDLDALSWQPVWIGPFLEYCHSRDLPVDFVSCHPYPTDWSLDPEGNGSLYTRGVDSASKDIALVRSILDASPYAGAELHLSEWNATPKSRDHTHDYPQAATYAVKVNLESIGLADSLAYWTFTDVFEEVGGGPSVFHGGFGLLNLQGIPKPTCHAYRFLHSLGDELLAKAPGGVVTRHSGTGALSAIGYHYPAQMPLAVPLSTPGREVADDTLALGTPEELTVNLTGLAPGATVWLETLDADHGNVVADWRRRGSPEHLSIADVVALRTAANNTLREKVYADESGRLSFTRSLRPWSVVLISER